ncbi:hypothetical protein J6590_008428 [Homalodisca vitripennis]|nr:hypothetical protein J6590_008428 [Homalodisca vitripennis]
MISVIRQFTSILLLGCIQTKPDKQLATDTIDLLPIVTLITSIISEYLLYTATADISTVTNIANSAMNVWTLMLLVVLAITQIYADPQQRHYDGYGYERPLVGGSGSASASSAHAGGLNINTPLGSISGSAASSHAASGSGVLGLFGASYIPRLPTSQQSPNLAYPTMNVWTLMLLVVLAVTQIYAVPQQRHYDGYGYERPLVGGSGSASASSAHAGGLNINTPLGSISGSAASSHAASGSGVLGLFG